MRKSPSISEELRGIAPSLEKIDEAMPYTVPEGYFETFPEMMLAMAHASASRSLAVPEGYFDQLPGLILQKVRGLAWEEELAAEAPALLNISRKMPQEVPEGYFDQLPKGMLAALKSGEWQEELEALAPVLLGISRQMPYTVPEGYFDTVPAIPAEVPVVALKARHRSTLLRVAAAVVMLLAAFAVYRMASQEAEPDAVINTTAGAAATTDTLAASFASELTGLDDASLDALLSEVGVTGENRSTLYYLNTTNFEAALQDFSTDELDSYLKEQPVLQKDI